MQTVTLSFLAKINHITKIIGKYGYIDPFLS